MNLFWLYPSIRWCISVCASLVAACSQIAQLRRARTWKSPGEGAQSQMILQGAPAPPNDHNQMGDMVPSSWLSQGTWGLPTAGVIRSSYQEAWRRVFPSKEYPSDSCWTAVENKPSYVLRIRVVSVSISQNLGGLIVCRTVEAGIPCEEKGACNFDLSDPWLEGCNIPTPHAAGCP